MSKKNKKKKNRVRIPPVTTRDRHTDNFYVI